MKIDFESRLMPNVKFKLFPLDADEHERKRIFNIVKELPNFPVLYFGYRTNFNGSIIYNGFKNQEAMDNYDGNAQKEVSIYEAIPKLIPDGMRYNKELDKLVPDVITDFKPKEKSMCDWAEEIYKINFVAFDDVEMNKNEYRSGIKIEDIKVENNIKENHRVYNIGSSNYASMKIQPWDVWKDWKLDPWDADIIKRISRTKEIPGKSFEDARIEDYEKIKHICDEKIYQLKEKNKC